jgi:hypothetical protein
VHETGDGRRVDEEEGPGRVSDYYDWGEVFICLGKLKNKAKRGRGIIDNR